MHAHEDHAPAPRGPTTQTILDRAWARCFVAAVLLAGALGGCACRPGYVGPYGGVHPARCWAW
jgi:hypothetical protein